MYERTIDNALTREELDHLKPSMEELFQNTWRATTWYNEAVWTAASLFVEAAQQSDKFRNDFLADSKVVKQVGDGENATSVEVAAWRNTMKQEVPEYHEKVMGIGLSAFQGGSAEQQARRYIEENL